jgi:hypothetical protein
VHIIILYIWIILTTMMTTTTPACTCMNMPRSMALLLPFHGAWSLKLPHTHTHTHTQAHMPRVIAFGFGWIVVCTIHIKITIPPACEGHYTISELRPFLATAANTVYPQLASAVFLANTRTLTQGATQSQLHTHMHNNHTLATNPPSPMRTSEAMQPQANARWQTHRLCSKMRIAGTKHGRVPEVRLKTNVDVYAHAHANAHGCCGCSITNAPVQVIVLMRMRVQGRLCAGVAIAGAGAVASFY